MINFLVIFLKLLYIYIYIYILYFAYFIAFILVNSIIIITFDLIYVGEELRSKEYSSVSWCR